jgi:hypothetical protein
VPTFAKVESIHKIFANDHLKSWFPQSPRFRKHVGMFAIVTATGTAFCNGDRLLWEGTEHYHKERHHQGEECAVDAL